MIAPRAKAVAVVKAANSKAPIATAGAATAGAIACASVGAKLDFELPNSITITMSIVLARDIEFSSEAAGTNLKLTNVEETYRLSHG